MGCSLFSRLFLKSSLVHIDMSELDKQMKSDYELREILTTPAEDLPYRYSYLLGEVFAGWKALTLYDLIKQSFDKLGNDKVYFSKAGNKLVGWAAYEVDATCRFRPYTFVSEIKTFSFDVKRPNPVLFRDLKELLDKLIEEYKEVTWIAVKENPANDIYEKVIKVYNGTRKDINDKLFEYSIVSKEE